MKHKPINRYTGQALITKIEHIIMDKIPRGKSYPSHQSHLCFTEINLLLSKVRCGVKISYFLIYTLKKYSIVQGQLITIQIYSNLRS